MFSYNDSSDVLGKSRAIKIQETFIVMMITKTKWTARYVKTYACRHWSRRPREFTPAWVVIWLFEKY